MGFYWDYGKNGNYYSLIGYNTGFVIGIMDNKMKTII